MPVQRPTSVGKLYLMQQKTVFKEEVFIQLQPLFTEVKK